MGKRVVFITKRQKKISDLFFCFQGWALENYHLNDVRGLDITVHDDLSRMIGSFITCVSLESTFKLTRGLMKTFQKLGLVYRYDLGGKVMYSIANNISFEFLSRKTRRTMKLSLEQARAAKKKMLELVSQGGKISASELLKKVSQSVGVEVKHVYLGQLCRRNGPLQVKGGMVERKSEEAPTKKKEDAQKLVQVAFALHTFCGTHRCTPEVIKKAVALMVAMREAGVLKK